MAGRQLARWREDNSDGAKEDDGVEAWMARRIANLWRLGPEAEAAGREAWAQSTRQGQNLTARRPGDVVAIGARALDPGTPRNDTPDPADGSPTGPGGQAAPNPPRTIEPPIQRSETPDFGELGQALPDLRFATARPGDSISRLLGASDPGSIGRFVGLNNLDGRSSTLRAGQSYAIPTRFDDASPDERAMGERLLRTDDARLDGLRAQRARGQAETDRFVELFNRGFNPWTGEYVGSDPETRSAPRLQSNPIASRPPDGGSRSWLDRSAAARGAGGSVARAAGDVVGVARGAGRLIEGLGEGANFASRLLDPTDAESSPRGEAAWDQVLGAGTRILDYARRGLANPGAVSRDIGTAAQKFNENTNPQATPMAETFPGELRRSFEIGKNQGEFAFDLGSAAAGGEVAKSLAGLGRLSKEALVAKQLARGFTPAQADYLAEAYEGMGHHTIPRRFTFPEKVGGVPLPDFLVGRPLPRAISDSPLNVVKPEGISRGEFYEQHYGVDPRFYGAKLRADRGGGSWSGKRLGLQKYDDPSRIWHGTSGPLKMTVGGGLVGAAGLADWALDREGGQ